MDIKLKNYSHSWIVKTIVFIVTILCFTGALTVFLNTTGIHRGNFDIAFERDYYLGQDYINESNQISELLTNLIAEYKSEEHILNGGTVTKEEVNNEKSSLFSQFENNYPGFDHELRYEENYQKFEELYADEIAQIKDKLIEEDLKQYYSSLRRLQEIKGIYYYGSDGQNVFTNSPSADKDYFKTYPSYLIFSNTEVSVYPQQVKENNSYYWIESKMDSMQQQDSVIYIAFTNEFLNPRIDQWKESKGLVTNSLNQIMGLTLGLAASFICLLVLVGRKFLGDKEVHLNFVDRLYTDANMVICFSLIALWFGIMMNFVSFGSRIYQIVFPITLFIGTLGLIFVLSLVKHIKNGTIIKHSLIYMIFHKLFKFIKEIYDSGSIGIKVVLVVVGYPIIAALTFFMFPVTIGVGAWLAFKKVQEFKIIKEGIQKVKEGDLHHKINVAGNGELAKLADDINSITDGLNRAVANELKSERLKTELITNVSHDIRTPLTSIITYVDLLKNEKDPETAKGYIEIIDQKSQRLKTLTEDLFEAAKASSGDIPVNYEKIEVASLITQGLGELNDKIQELKLEFKLSYPKDKLYIKADGKLLWRAVENLLSNIFKYALEGSRVYIDIEDLGSEVLLVIKNISAYELNISSDELMERFKRGDESRSSQGSGLGLSIAKSLIDIQNGSFTIEIDGDLFKAKIQMPKYQ